MRAAKLGRRVLLLAGLRLLLLHELAYRWSDGRLGAEIGHLSLLLLRTQGRHSGRERTSALLYGRDGDRLVVVGSKGGSDSPPGWLLNLEANPEAEVQVGRRRWPVRARRAAGRERERLWELMNKYWDYDGYQALTHRRIPVVVLEPKGGTTQKPQSASSRGRNPSRGRASARSRTPSG